MLPSRSIFAFGLMLAAAGILLFSCGHGEDRTVSPVDNSSEYAVVVWFISTNPNHGFKPMVYSFSSKTDSLLDSATVIDRWDHICFSSDGLMISCTNRLTSFFVADWPISDTVGYDNTNLCVATCFNNNNDFIALSRPCIFSLPAFDMVYGDTSGVAGCFIFGGDRYAYIRGVASESNDRMMIVDLTAIPSDSVSYHIIDKDGSAVRPQSVISSQSGDSLFVPFASDSAGSEIYYFGIYDAASLALLDQYRVTTNLNYKMEAKLSAAGDKIYFRQGWDYGFPGFHGEIYAVDIQSGAVTKPVADSLGATDAPTAMALTPDGKFLYFIVSEERIYRLDLSGGKIEECCLQLKGKGRVKGLGINPIPLNY